VVTPDPAKSGAVVGQLGLHRAKTVVEIKALESNMGGKLADNYVMGPLSASAVFYEVRKCFN